MDYETVENLQKLAREARARALEAYEKKQETDAVYYSQKYVNIRKKLKNAPQYYPKHLFAAGAGCVTGMVVGLMAYGMCMDTLLEAYLMRPENDLIVQEMLSETGLSSLRDLAAYMTGYNEAGQALLIESGAKEYLSNYGLAMSLSTAVAGTALAQLPYLRDQINFWRNERVTKKKAANDAEYSKAKAHQKVLARQAHEASVEYYQEQLRNSSNKGLGNRNLPVVHYYVSKTVEAPATQSQECEDAQRESGAAQTK